MDMLFVPNYVKKETKSLNRIAEILERLDASLASLDEANSQASRETQQRKAVQEIKQFMRESKRLEGIQDRKADNSEYGTDGDYARQRQALQDIEVLCEQIAESAESIEGTMPRDSEQSALLDRTVAEIMAILDSTGNYENYLEDERERPAFI